MSGLPSWVKPGVRCVCVVQMFHYHDAQRKWAPSIPELNGVYTVREVLHAKGIVGILLEEIHNPVGPTGWETAFEIDKFRPLVSQSDDIAVHFSRHLKNDHRAPERASA